MDTDESEPVIFGNNFNVKLYLKKHPHLHYLDILDRQIKELFVIEHKQFIGVDDKTMFGAKEFQTYLKSKSKCFSYVHYPWNDCIIKCIDEKSYYELLTNRNRDLITSEEQKKLYGLKMAVFGMSVGSNIAFVLTQSGISKKITIADFDILDTTNLNRIWAGVHQVGLNKCVVASRRIYENNPYAKVRSLKNGITIQILEKLVKDKEIDCIIEEIDDMKLKIKIREVAMKHKIPVLMVTDNGDGVVLHIERYDLGHNKIFEEDLKHWNIKMKDCCGKEGFADIVINHIVGGADKVDPRMLKSAHKVMDKELVSWPQLGSTALLGGVLTTIAIKNIIRGTDKKQFSRIYLNPLSGN